MLFYPAENYGTVEDPKGQAGEQTVQLILHAIKNADE